MPPLKPKKTQKPRKPKRKTTKVPQPSESINIAADEAVHKEGVTVWVISSSDNEALDKEDTSKQGRIDDLDADEDIALVSTHDDVVQDEGIEDFGEEEVVEVVTIAKILIDTVIDVAQVTTALTITAESTKTNVKDKGKRNAKLIEEPEMPKKRKHQIKADKELAKKLQVEIDEEDRLAREGESLLKQTWKAKHMKSLKLSTHMSFIFISRWKSVTRCLQIRLTGLIQKVINKGSGQDLSISKMKAARYLDFGLELLVPEHLWINEVCTMTSVPLTVYLIGGLIVKNSTLTNTLLTQAARNTRLQKRISKADDSHAAPTRNLVIQQRVEDFQLGIESYQKHLNLTKPGWDEKGFEYKHDYTIIESPRVVVFPVALDYRVKEYKVNRLNPDSKPEGSFETWNALLVVEYEILATDSFREPNEHIISAFRDTFTPLTKMPKEILAMEGVNFPLPPPLIGTPEKQNLNKFCDYHGDRGHNTNDCFPPEEANRKAVTLGKLAHLLKDICRGETYHPLGLIDLRVTMGEPGKSKIVLLEFAIIKCRSPYNVIIGRTEMRILRAVGLTIHSMIKFLTDKGVATMRTSKEALWEYKQIETNAKFMEGDAMIRRNILFFTHMPKGLKNSAATLQKMMDKVLEGQKGGNADVYLEEVVVKSKIEESLIEDIEETMHKLRRVNIKIDPSKCTCGMEEGNFLSLSLQLTNIIRFIPKMAELMLPICKIRKSLDAAKESNWTTEATKAFQKIKRKLTKLPTLTVPRQGEDLMVCLRPRSEMTSSVLFVERNKVQTPILMKEAEGQVVQKFFGQGEQVPHMPDKNKEEASGSREKPQEELVPMPREWRLYVGREAGKEGFGVGMILDSLEGKIYSYAIR
nr:hypothetical protein [Tanacetum cinerariifolium]